MQQSNTNQPRIRVNHFIRVPQVRVILADGTNAGVMETRDALQMAYDQGLDLIEINPKAAPPVCLLTQLGKWKYDQKKQEAAARKNQKVVELKELILRPTTEDNDLNHKLEQAKEFLSEGNKVKFTVKFRGREITHSHLGREKLEHILQQLAGLISDNVVLPALEGKAMSMVVSPKADKG
jgi:translation initiation factor IF-3